MFKRSRKKNIIKPTSPTNYPYGTCIETEAGWFLIRERGRFRIPTKRVLESWRFNVVPSSESAVKHVKISGKMGFRDGSLIKNVANGQIYLISRNKRMHITNPDIFDRYGFDWNSVILVSSDETNLHDDGEVLD